MNFYLTYDALMDIPVLHIKDTDGSLIVSFHKQESLPNDDYIVSDSDGNTIFVVKETDTNKQYTIYDHNSREIATLLKTMSLPSPIKIKCKSHDYRHRISIRDFSMKLSKDGMPAITSTFERKDNKNMLYNIVHDTQDPLLSIAIYITIGIVFDDAS